MDIYQIFISSVLAVTVLLGISMMSRVKTAVAGNFLSAVALLTGVGVTLLFAGIISVWTLWVAIAIGALVGSLLAQRVKMIHRTRRRTAHPNGQKKIQRQTEHHADQRTDNVSDALAQPLPQRHEIQLHLNQRLMIYSSAVDRPHHKIARVGEYLHLQ